MPLSGRFFRFLPKLGFASLACFTIVQVLYSLVWPQFAGQRLIEALMLSSIITVAIIIYALACYIFGIIHKQDLQKLRSAFAKKKS